MNYIGSKFSLIDFLKNGISETLKLNSDVRNPSNMIFADVFAGTGCVGGSFKALGYSVIANDLQYYSYIITKHMIENNGNLDKIRIENLIDQLNKLNGKEGFIYNNYSDEGTKNQEFVRKYFTGENAKKCDEIRDTIEEWLEVKYINEHEYYFLLGSLLNSIDKCANTASVYGAYLKAFKKSALKPLVIIPIPIMHGKVQCQVYNQDANDLIKIISGDILYLDPPYNARQYCTNYHMLETIAKNDSPLITGKTGLREYKKQKSKYCSKATVLSEFEELVKNAKFKYIFLSYNNEGLMTLEDVEKIMSKYGSYHLCKKEYKRFKADSKRNNKSATTTEYLHCLIKKMV